MGLELFDPRIGSDLSLDTTIHNFAKTGTGLDDIVRQILRDPGLNQYVDGSEIVEGANAAAAMNAIIVEGIKATGIANSGKFQASDIYVLSDWISANHLNELRAYHGNDENGVETGYHLVQGDGARLDAYGSNIANTLGDALYHIGLGIRNGHLINEDGDQNARLEKVAYWMNAVLDADLANGSLKNAVIQQYVSATTGTGLDATLTMIQTDPGLARKISLKDINDASIAADTINHLIVDGILELGIANDKLLDTADIRSLSEWVRTNHYPTFNAAHGNDENGVETGFHLAQNDGGETRLFGQSAMNTVLDGIYHIGFEVEHGRLKNEDGDLNATLRTVAFWLNEFLEDDLEDGSLSNSAVDLSPDGTTGTALDQTVGMLVEDEALRRHYSATEMAEFGRVANALNDILIEATKATGAANNGGFTGVDLAVVSQWIRDNKLSEWSSLRGNDDADTGIAGLRWKGAAAEFAGVNMVNTFMSELYGLGHTHQWGGIQDEDGDWLGRLDDLAVRLNHALSDDLAAGTLAGSGPSQVNPASFADDAVAVFDGTVANATNEDYVRIDHESAMQLRDGALTLSFKANDLSNNQTLVAKDAKGQNTDDFALYIYDGKLWIRTVDAGDTKYIDFPVALESGQTYDIAISFGSGGLVLWMNGEQVHYDGASKFDLASNQNDLVIGLTNGGQTRNGDGWLWGYFDGDVSNVALYDRPLERAEIAGLSNSAAPISVIHHEPLLTVEPPAETISVAKTGTGLDKLVDAVLTDVGLARYTDTADIHEGAKAAAGMNAIIIEAIKATGAANDGEIQINDIHRINDWVAKNRLDALRVLHGDDENGVETGFHLVQGDGSTGATFGRNEINTVADAIYHIGFGIKHQHLVNEDGDGNEAIERVAYWLNELLADDMDTLANANIVVQPYYSTGTGLDRLTQVLADDIGLDKNISANDLDKGVAAAAQMNAMVIKAIKATGVANDGAFSAPDMATVADYIRANDKAAWIKAHGDDEGNVETGFHLIQGDGGTARLYGEAAANTVADGIYHLGFGYKHGHLVNEDGDTNQSLEKVSYWLEDILQDELSDGSLANPNVSLDVQGSTGSGLDALVTMIMKDEGLHNNYSSTQIVQYAQYVRDMTEILHEGMVATGVANDGSVSVADMIALDAWVGNTHLANMRALDNKRLSLIEKGDMWSATSPIFGEHGVARVVDTLFEIGNGTAWGTSLLNKFGNWTGHLEDISNWLEDLWNTDPISSAPAVITPPPEPEPLPEPTEPPETEPEPEYATNQVGTDAEDPFVGTSGADFLDGRGGRDNINGGGGNDYIIAGAGNDWWVRGGTGNDIFQFGLGDGDVSIHDFGNGADKIKLVDGLKFSDLLQTTTSYNGSTNTIFRTTEGDRLLLIGAEPETVMEADFIA